MLGEKTMIREMSGYEVKALHYELLLKDILTAAEKLPPFPDVVWKVMSLLRKMAPIKQIEEVIQYDPIIAARILRLSQSTHYSRRHKVTSLKDAILVLGNQKLVQVVMAACTSQYFQKKVTGNARDDRELWRHSVATAFMGEILSGQMKSKRGLTIYTACLLHDIGKIVLDLYARMYLQVDLDPIRHSGAQFIEAERRALGIDHQELGRIIARRWQFPREVASGIQFHHTPDRADSDREIAQHVYAANLMVNPMKDEAITPAELQEDPVFQGMGLSEDRILKFQDFLLKSMEGVELYLKNGA